MTKQTSFEERFEERFDKKFKHSQFIDYSAIKNFFCSELQKVIGRINNAEIEDQSHDFDYSYNYIDKELEDIIKEYGLVEEK